MHDGRTSQHTFNFLGSTNIKLVLWQIISAAQVTVSPEAN